MALTCPRDLVRSLLRIRSLFACRFEMSNSHDLADPCDYPWFRELGEIKDGVVRICVRKHPDLPYVWIRVRYADYVHRVSSWLNYVKQYWIQQFEMNMTKPSLAPVPTAIAAAASWVFGRDLGFGGGFLLRIYLGELLGRFRWKLVSVRDVLSLATQFNGALSLNDAS